MPVELQTMSIPFSGGIDTKTDAKLVAAGSLTDIQDGVYTKNLAINKRFGYDALTTNVLNESAFTSANKIDSLNQELLLLNSSKLYSYSSNLAKWLDKGKVSNVDTSTTLVANTSVGFTSSAWWADVAVNSNIKVVAWFTTNGTPGIHASVFDATTGAQILSDVFIFAPTATAFDIAPVLLSVGTYIYILYISANNLHYRRLDVSSPTAFGADTTLVGGGIVDAARVGNLDAITFGSNALIAYLTGPSTVVLMKVDSNLANVVAPVSFTSTNNQATSLSYDAANNNVYVAVNNATGIQYTGYNSNLVVIAALSTLVTIQLASATFANLSSIVESANNLRVFYDCYTLYGAPFATLSDFRLATGTGTVGGVATHTDPIIRGVSLGSKPFVYNSISYVLCKTNYTNQATYFLINSSGDIVSKANNDRALPNAILSGDIYDKMSAVISVNTGQYEFVKEYITQDVVTQGNNLYSTNIADMNFDMATTKVQNIKNINNTSLISGGYPELYDGAIVSELGFNYIPFTVLFSQTTPGGNLDAGTYTYYFTYEWIDAQGNIYRSEPSTGFVIVVAANSTYVTITAPTLKLTTKLNVKIVAYRTEANGTVPYRITSLGVNDPTVDYVSFVDSTLNTPTLISQPQLYTNGGVLENSSVLAFEQIETFKNRILIAGLEDKNSFGFSKTIVPGEGVNFNGLFYVSIDGYGPKINATKSLDDKIIIFKDNAIFAMTGDGPLDTGQQDTFTEPQIINSDVGCPYPDSIVLYPAGLIFKSYKGFYLLDRSLTVSYIGAPVEAYNSQTVRAATLLQAVNQIRFVCDSGRSLVYDYAFNKWSTFSNHTGYSATNWNGTYSYLRTNAVVYTEKTDSSLATTFRDNGTAIVLHPTTPWIKVNSIEGFQRVRRAAFLGNYFSAHILTVKVYYDYNDSSFDTYTFNTSTGLIGGDTVYQFRMHLKRQKCEAIKFEFYDTAIGAPGQSYSINDLTLEIGIKRGIDKLPAIKSVG